nr:MAG TPA_asm: hypothetical protein [Caudoviricetes sp.]
MEPTLIVHFLLIGIDRLYSLVLSDAKVVKLIVKVWKTEWKDSEKSWRRKGWR